MSVSTLAPQDRLRPPPAAAASRAKAVGGPSCLPAAARDSDSLTNSDAVRSLGAAHAAVANTPDVREDRVSALQAAIADGSHAVDSGCLAAKLLESSRS